MLSIYSKTRIPLSLYIIFGAIFASDAALLAISSFDLETKCSGISSPKRTTNLFKFREELKKYIHSLQILFL